LGEDLKRLVETKCGHDVGTIDKRMMEMKVFLMIVAGLILAGVLFFVVLAVLSQKEPDNLGMHQGKLRVCSDAPNCVCSEAHSMGDDAHFIQTISTLSVKGDVWKLLQAKIVEQGGKLEKVEPNYLYATFSSPLFHYVDDVECRLDKSAGVIHIRSASRVGHSDLGVNRKRVEALRTMLQVTAE